MDAITERKLTEKQTALVDTLVANGCSIKKAAELAGYSKGESGRVSASKALKLPHVQQYMMPDETSSIEEGIAIANC